MLDKLDNLGGIVKKKRKKASCSCLKQRSALLLSALTQTGKTTKAAKSSPHINKGDRLHTLPRNYAKQTMPSLLFILASCVYSQRPRPVLHCIGSLDDQSHKLIG